MVAQVYLPPTATRGAWVLMSPAQVDPVTIHDTIWESFAEAWEERRYSERRMGTNMEDIVTSCEGTCRKRCHPRVPAEESHKEVTSSISASKAGRYQKRGSPKPSKEAGKSAMEMTPSPVRRTFSAPPDSEVYHTRKNIPG